MSHDANLVGDGKKKLLVEAQYGPEDRFSYPVASQLPPSSRQAMPVQR